MNQENPIIVGLDIGTTKIPPAIAGRKNEYGKLEILGFGRANRQRCSARHGAEYRSDHQGHRNGFEELLRLEPNLEIGGSLCWYRGSSY